MIFSKILNKLNNKHFLSLAGNGSMAVLSVVTYAILYRFLSADDMGNWIFFQFAFILVDSFRTGFLQTGLIKFYAGAEQSRRTEVAGSGWYIAIIITVAFAILNVPALLAMRYFTDTGVHLFLKWCTISLFLTLPFNVTFWILQAEERFDRILILRIVNQGVFIVLLLIAFFSVKLTIETIIYLFLISSLITSTVSIILGWSRIATVFKKNAETVKSLFHFGKYSVGTYICSGLLRSSDVFIIKFLLGPSAIAVYNLPQRLGEIIEIPLRSFVSTAMPAMSAAYNENNKDKVLYIMKKYTGTITMFLIPVIIAMLVFADVMVMLIGGGKYVGTESANIFRIFMLFALLAPIERFPGITLDIIHKPELNLLKVVASLIVNVIADIIFIKLIGNIYGAAIASFFTLLFSVAFGYFSLRKYLPFRINGIMKLGYYEFKMIVSGFIRKAFN